jgi:hypothetical protein
MIGIMMYSYAVSSLSNYIQISEQKTEVLHNKMETLNEIRIQNKINMNLYNKICRFIKYDHKLNKFDTNTFLSQLPVSLRNEMMTHMYKDIINNFVYFRNFNNLEFINRVLLVLKPVRANKNDILISEGEFVDETIFVKYGLLSLEVTLDIDSNLDNIKNKLTTKKKTILEKLTQKMNKPDKYTLSINEKNNNKFQSQEIQVLKIIQLRKYEHFGDVLMFLNKPSILRIRVKSKIADLLLMKKVDFTNISKDFPEIFKDIYTKSVHNMDKIESLVIKAKSIFLKRQDYPINNIDIISQRSIFPNKDLISEKSLSNTEQTLSSCLENYSNRSFLSETHHNQSIKYTDVQAEYIMKLYDSDHESVAIFNQENSIEKNINCTESSFSSDTIKDSDLNKFLYKGDKSKDNFIYGYMSKNLDKFYILDGEICNDNLIEHKFLKIKSIPWMNSKIDSPISFSINPLFKQSTKVTFKKYVPINKPLVSQKNSRNNMALDIPMIPMRSDEKIVDKIRRRSMLNNIERNIAYSRNNIYDPEKYYQDMFKQMNKTNKNSYKKLNENQKLINKLERINNILKDKIS